MIDTKIQFLDFARSEAVESVIWEHIESLEKLNNQIMSCHVVISRPHRKQHQGRIFHIKLRMHLPGTEIIVDKDPGKNHAHEDVYVAIRDAFWAARRKVEDFMRIRSGIVKQKVRPTHGKIIRILYGEECGFLISEDSREIYFHRNSILNEKFEDLKVGQEVRFSESLGDNGPQVSSMELVGQSGHIIPV